MKDEQNVVDLAFAIERFSARLERIAQQRGYAAVTVTGTAKLLRISLDSTAGTRVDVTFPLPIDVASILAWVAQIPYPLVNEDAWSAPTHATPLVQLRAAQRQAHGEDE